VIGDTDAEGSPIVVGLAGRVPVRVNNENRSKLLRGDYITSSSVPGVGMKSTEPGMVIGKALTSFNSDTEGTVLVFIQNTYFDGVYDEDSTLDQIIDGVSAIGQTLSPSDSNDNRTVFADGSIADRFTHMVRRALEKLSNWYMDIVLWVREIKTDTLTIGDTDNPNGFTMFDTATGAPYCVMVTNGQLLSTSGACGSSTTAASVAGGTTETTIPADRSSDTTDTTTDATGDSSTITDIVDTAADNSTNESRPSESSADTSSSAGDTGVPSF